MNKRPRLEGEAMNEGDLRRLIDAVRRGKLSRRRYVCSRIGTARVELGQLRTNRTGD